MRFVTLFTLNNFGDLDYMCDYDRSLPETGWLLFESTKVISKVAIDVGNRYY